MEKILPVILSGGSGSRLWPSSRSMYPKQLLPIGGPQTMLQATAVRLDNLNSSVGRYMVVCNEAHRFLVAEQLAAIEKDALIVLEPEGRNTAPAIALAALHASKSDPDAILLVMPADHIIKDTASFQSVIERGVEAAQDGKLVTFGIVPTYPETGFGYIKATPSNGNAVEIESFVEKPDAETAAKYLADGAYFWNSGMFLFKVSIYLEALRNLAPDIYTSCEKAMGDESIDGQFIRPQKEAFLECRSDSIDYTVMEKSVNAAMIPLDAGWTDVGSWAAVHDVMPSDADGNAIDGDVVMHNCEGSLVQAESRLVGMVGLKDVVVVETKDSVLVADKHQSQHVKELVNKLKEDGRPETELHRQVFRPWGSYDSLENQDGFQVKRLIVNPGAILSLQKHAHRAEHWVVVRGKARITKNDDEFDLGVNESTYIAIGDIHRIANPFDEPVHIIEVQCGNYLGEDDIVRIEDNYGREGTNT